MNKKIFSIFLFLIVLLNNFILCHDNLQVHPTITWTGKKILSDKLTLSVFLQKYLELKLYTPHVIYPPKGYHIRYENITEGSYGEDEIWFGAITVSHFYHYGSAGQNGLWGKKSAFKRSLDVMKEAVNYYDYTESSKRLAYYTLGRVVHLLEDMSVPAHVQNDAHINLIATTSGPLIGDYDDYEKYVFEPRNNKIAEIESKGDNYIEQTNIKAYFDGLAEKSHTASSFQAILDKNTGVGSGELAKMFPDLNYEAATPLGIPIYHYWNIGEVGNYYPAFSFLGCNEWWPLIKNGAKSPDYDTLYYLENIEHAVPEKIRKDLLKSYNASTNPMQDNDELLTELYFQNLIKPANEYAAGLIKYFHDRVNHPPYLKSVLITNGSDTCYEGNWIDDLHLADCLFGLRKVNKRFLNQSGRDKKKDIDDIILNFVKIGDMDDPIPLQCGTAYNLKLEFSEPVKDVDVKIKFPDGTFSPSLSGTLSDSIWTGSFSFNAANTAQKLAWENNTATIEVTAKDKNTHYVSDSTAFADGIVLDANPASPAKRTVTISTANDDNYAWSGYDSGPDINHGFIIDNFPDIPYLISVTIKQCGQIVYNKVWQPDSNDTTGNFRKVDVSSFINEQIWDDIPIQMDLMFNYPIQNGKIFLSDGRILKDGLNGQVFNSISFSAAQVKRSVGKSLYFYATDVGGRELDRDPSTIKYEPGTDYTHAPNFQHCYSDISVIVQPDSITLHNVNGPIYPPPAKTSSERTAKIEIKIQTNRPEEIWAGEVIWNYTYYNSNPPYRRINVGAILNTFFNWTSSIDNLNFCDSKTFVIPANATERYNRYGMKLYDVSLTGKLTYRVKYKSEVVRTNQMYPSIYVEDPTFIVGGDENKNEVIDGVTNLKFEISKNKILKDKENTQIIINPQDKEEVIVLLDYPDQEIIIFAQTEIDSKLIIDYNGSGVDKTGRYNVVVKGKQISSGYIYELRLPLNINSIIASIDVPENNAIVKANIPIYGKVYGDSFSYYKLEFTKGDFVSPNAELTTPNPPEWITINQSSEQWKDYYLPETLISLDRNIEGNLGTWATGLVNYSYPNDPRCIDLEMEFSLMYFV